MRRLKYLIRFCETILFSWLYIPHLLLFFFCEKKNEIIKGDLDVLRQRFHINFNDVMSLLYLYAMYYYRQEE